MKNLPLNFIIRTNKFDLLHFTFGDFFGDFNRVRIVLLNLNGLRFGLGFRAKQKSKNARRSSVIAAIFNHALELNITSFFCKESVITKLGNFFFCFTLTRF